MISELAKRYAKAIFQAASDQGAADKVFAELSEISKAINLNPETKSFFQSPTISSSDKQRLMSSAISGHTSEISHRSILALIENGRFSEFSQVVAAFEEISDEARGLKRGKVRSSSALTADQRSMVEQTVNRAVEKKVVLSFQEDSTLLGGNIAQVGGWSFDDSLQSHLKRMSEELNRRTH